MWTALAWRSGSGNGGKRWEKKKHLEGGVFKENGTAACNFSINEIVQETQEYSE